MALPGYLIAVRGDKGKTVDGWGKSKVNSVPPPFFSLEMVSASEIASYPAGAAQSPSSGKPLRLGYQAGERNARSSMVLDTTP